MERDRDALSFLPREALADLVGTLRAQGYTVVGPVEREGAVVLGKIEGAGDLARGLRDVQEGGRYRLQESEEDLYFEHAVGPDSPKGLFFPPHQELFSFQVEDRGFAVQADPFQAPRLALLGVRACDLEAIRIQDRIFGLEGAARCEADRAYAETRSKALLVAVNCTHPAGTCFCASMDTGPRARSGYDLALTELRGGFTVETGTDRGRETLASLPGVREASAAEEELADLKLELARERMGRSLRTEGIVALLDATIEHPRWEEVAGRCLSCGNCTMVCPTCFCSTVIDTTDPSRGEIRRSLHWESCFTHQFTYLTTGPHRSTIRGRYRHWLRHKLGTWWEQFGTTGCVGCGRCITWCPVGIDLTEEVAALRNGTPGG